MEIHNSLFYKGKMVPGGGFEPPTRGFSKRYSFTKLLLYCA